jgi:hypothetical protein
MGVVVGSVELIDIGLEQPRASSRKRVVVVKLQMGGAYRSSVHLHSSNEYVTLMMHPSFPYLPIIIADYCN